MKIWRFYFIAMVVFSTPFYAVGLLSLELEILIRTILINFSSEIVLQTCCNDYSNVLKVCQLISADFQLVFSCISADFGLIFSLFEAKTQYYIWININTCIDDHTDALEVNQLILADFKLVFSIFPADLGLIFSFFKVKN